jgi:hypothetical protein
MPDVVVMREFNSGHIQDDEDPLAGFENDASANFDRIVMNLVAAVFRLGVPPVLSASVRTTDTSSGELKTGFGISTASHFRCHPQGSWSRPRQQSWYGDVDSS